MGKAGVFCHVTGVFGRPMTDLAIGKKNTPLFQGRKDSIFFQKQDKDR
jgi:hypothetical protein